MFQRENCWINDLYMIGELIFKNLFPELIVREKMNVYSKYLVYIWLNIQIVEIHLNKSTDD